MEKNISLTFTIILSLILLVAGFIAGFILKPVKLCPEPPTCPTCLSDLKMVQNWKGIASGKVKEIADRDLTLVSDKETIKISILEGAKIQFLDDRGTSEAQLTDIKKGNKVEVKFLVVSEDNLFGSLVTILSE